jgi:hypothetical protein
MKRVAASFLASVLMASCADLISEPSGDPAPAGAGSITVSTTYDESSCCYIEGFVPVIRIVGPGIYFEKDIERSKVEIDSWEQVVLEIPRGGEYMLKSWVEPCAGNCGTRDPATDHCAEIITVPEGAHLEVQIAIRTAHPCQLSVEGQ